MSKIIELKIKNSKNIYRELVLVLSSYKEEKAGSVIFIVEGSKRKPLIGIRYPGRKLMKRKLKSPRENSALWANLYDFEVIPYRNGKEVKNQKFTFEELFKDFENNKNANETFWKMIEEVYQENRISRKPPKLKGIDPLLYLLVLKWIWIQEDLNYKLNWEEVGSPVRYILQNKNGNRTSGGAGRAKFFAALILLKYGFNLAQIKKIVRFY